MKVLWRNHGIKEATWEVEEEIRKKYPELFVNLGMNFENEILLRWGECEAQNSLLLAYLFIYLFICLN